MSKPRPTSSATGTTNSAGDQAPYRINPEVDAKIDAYIRENPKYWSYVQGMPRERLERSVVLNEVQKLERQQRVREGLMKQINDNPQLKEAFETIVKSVPEGERENVMLQVAGQARRTIARSQSRGVSTS